MTYKTPGLYIKEHNNLSSTAAIISTAVPVFIGVTHKVPDKYDIDDPELVKISGLEDYKSHFGTSPYEPSRVFIDKYQQSPIQVWLIDKNDKLSQIMYYNMLRYFDFCRQKSIRRKKVVYLILLYGTRKCYFKPSIP